MSNANYLRETIDLVKQIETRFLELGARLYKVQQEKLWDGEYDSFMEFIDAAGLKRPFATILTTIHKVYVVEGRVSAPKLAAAGYSKLYDAIPLLEGADTKTVVAKATLLTLSELRDEVRDENHAECKHENIIQICADCKKRIYETKQS